MNSVIKVLATTIIAILFGYTSPVVAFDCTQKVLFSGIFQSVNTNGGPTVNEVELCTKSVLVVQSDIPISKIATSESEAIKISPIDSFTVIIHPVTEQELVISFFSGNIKEFIVLKIVESPNQSIASYSESTSILEDETIIFPVLISEVNLKSEGLEPGNLVDVMLVTDQLSDGSREQQLPRPLANKIKINSILPFDQTNSERFLSAERMQNASWVFLTLSPDDLAKIDNATAFKNIILLQSERNYVHAAGALDKLGEYFEREQITDPSYNERFKDTANDELRIESSSSNVDEIDKGIRNITIFRGTSETKIRCSTVCSQYDE